VSLPFLNKRKAAALIMEARSPEGHKTEMHQEQDSDPGAALRSCSEDLIRAVHTQNAEAVSSAIRAAFEILESEPHEEGPQENDYDSMNEQAGEGQE